MSDQEFLEMGPRLALEYWRNADSPKERERLHHLYLVRRKVNLSDLAARPDGPEAEAEAQPQAAPQPAPELVAWGMGVLWIGIAISVGTFLFMDPSVEVRGAYGALDRVANFDAMERRALIVGFGNALAIIGAVIASAGYVTRSIDRLRDQSAR